MARRDLGSGPPVVAVENILLGSQKTDAMATLSQAAATLPVSRATRSAARAGERNGPTQSELATAVR
jgi:hypothetical protein